MDTQIVIMGIASFIVFLVSIAMFFRRIDPDEALPILLRMFLVVGATCSFFSYRYWGMVGLIGGSLIYVLSSLLFIFGVFGVIEASITLRILAEISRGGGVGVTENGLLSRYNRDVIVKKRVARFLATGELKEKGSRYVVTKRLSYFLLREYFLRYLRRLFPSP